MSKKERVAKAPVAPTSSKTVKKGSGRVKDTNAGRGEHVPALYNIDRELTEDASNSSETKYRRLFESSKDGILILDARTGMIDDVNPYLIELLGYSKDQLLGKKVWEIGFLKDVVANQANFQRLQEKGFIRYDDMPLETASGQLKNVEFLSNVYQVDHRTVIQCNIRDISEHRRLTEVIQLRLRLMDLATIDSSEEFLWRALDEVCTFAQSPVGFIYTVDEEERTISFLASSTDSVNGSRRSEHKIKEYSLDKAYMFIKCICERRPIVYNDMASLPDPKAMLPGHSMIFRKILVPILREDRVVAVVCLGNKKERYTEQDMEVVPYIVDLVYESADRIRAKEDLMSVAKFPEENPNPILRTTKDGIMTYANPASAPLMSAWKCQLGDTLPQPYLETVIDTFRTGVLTRIEISEGERIFEAVLTPFIDQGYLNIYANEITERRRAEAALQKAYEWLLSYERLSAIGAVAGGMAHDLRNPLGSIKNAIFFLRMAIKDMDPKVLDTIDMMERDISVSEKVIKKLLDFARPKAPVRKRVLVTDVVKVTLDRVGVPKDIKVVLDIEGHMAILADPELMSIALSTLVQNAVQAMPDGGRLFIGCLVDKDPQGIVMSVTDTGVGIPQENLEWIFDPLFTTKPQGNGLGLPLARTLVEMQGGSIDVMSEPGKGSTFYLRVPTWRRSK